MGMALLANLAAYDFGYLPLGGLIERTANTLRTMERLERYHGHFYNWYDTQSLQPLLPMYVSTVDSGNLGGHLLTLQPGLLALPDQPILAARWLEGLVDTFGVLLENTQGMTPHQLIPLQAALETAKTTRPTTLAAAKHCLEHLMALAVGGNRLRGKLLQKIGGLRWCGSVGGIWMSCASLCRMGREMTLKASRLCGNCC